MKGLVIYKHTDIKCVYAMMRKIEDMKCYNWGIKADYRLRTYRNIENKVIGEIWELYIVHDEEFEEERIREALLNLFIENLMFFQI